MSDIKRTTYSVSATQPKEVKTDVLVVVVSEKEPIVVGLTPAQEKDIQKQLKKSEFTGSWGASELLIAPAGAAVSFIGLVGIGDATKDVATKQEGLRRALGSLLARTRQHTARTFSVVLPEQHTPEIAGAILEAIEMSDYRFVEYQKKAAAEHAAHSITRVVFLTSSERQSEVRAAIRHTQRIMNGVLLTRNLVNQPASHMSPSVLMQRASEIAQRAQHITVQIFDRAQAEQQNFSAFLAVARGSQEEPYVIHLVYKPTKNPKKKVALVGKGITFDSGGLSLKPSQSMENMKIDMAGAATVLGVFETLSALELDIEVHGIIAACENMPSGTAYRPGDIITAKNGKTIEVLNTDAEGRVTLADALVYAEEQKPDAIIDLATLTGACVVAVGDTYAGLWSNSDTLQQDIMHAAHKAGEGMVPFPLPIEYRPTIESKVADTRNTSSMSPYGGAITAALFLQEFIISTPWAHIDVAGPVYSEKTLIPYWQYGGTGYGVRSILAYLEGQEEKAQEHAA